MSGPKCSSYSVSDVQRRRLEEERRRREEAERKRREEERRHREDAERKRREEERRRHEEEKRKRREEEARQSRIRESDNIQDEFSANFKGFQSKKNISVEPSTENFDGQKFFERVNFLLTDLRLPVTLRERLTAAKENCGDKILIEVSVKPLFKECEKFFNLYEKISPLLMDYEILCGMAKESVKNFSVEESSVAQIESEILRLREKIAQDDEREYIDKCLDEVMRDMGYDVIGTREVTKKSGSHFRQELFSYADGTAVNATFKSDGSITMELVGLDDNDRPPDPAESKTLVEHMENFCDDFSEFERRLAEKGVISKKISHLPPSEEHAKIINVEKFETIRDVKHMTRKHRSTSTPRVKQVRDADVGASDFLCKLNPKFSIYKALIF